MKFSREYLNLKQGSCFVIMPFGVKKLPDGGDFDWDHHYKEVISPVIADIGMTPIRGDDIFGTGPFMEQIWQGIQEAELIIADLTGRSPNVMYELVHRFIKEFTLNCFSEGELFPSMNDRFFVDFFDSFKNSFFKFFDGLNSNFFQKCPCHLTKECFN